MSHKIVSAVSVIRAAESFTSLYPMRVLRNPFPSHPTAQAAGEARLNLYFKFLLPSNIPPTVLEPNWDTAALLSLGLFFSGDPFTLPCKQSSGVLASPVYPTCPNRPPSTGNPTEACADVLTIFNYIVSFSVILMFWHLGCH